MRFEDCKIGMRVRDNRNLRGEIIGISNGKDSDTPFIIVKFDSYGESTFVVGIEIADLMLDEKTPICRDISLGWDERIDVRMSKSDFIVLLDIIECACEQHPNFEAWRRIFDELYGFCPIDVSKRVPLDGED